MARTTLDIDASVLKELKRLQVREGKSLGRLVSELLAHALAHQRSTRRGPPPFRWISRPMRPRIDLSDKEALHAVLEEPASR